MRYSSGKKEKEEKVVRSYERSVVRSFVEEVKRVGSGIEAVTTQSSILSLFPRFSARRLLGIGATTGPEGANAASREGSETFTAAHHDHSIYARKRRFATSRGDDATFQRFDSAGASLIGNLGLEANGRPAPIRFLFLSSHVKYVAY